MPKLKPIHPGEILREEFMAPLKLNAKALALALHVPARDFSEIIRERRGISSGMALRLASAFKTTPFFWLKLQSEFSSGAAMLEDVEDIRVSRSRRDERRVPLAKVKAELLRNGKLRPGRIARSN